MIEKRHLPHAPIKEALNSKYTQIADQYPKHEALQRGEFGLHSDEGQPTKVTIGQSVVGYRYTI